MQRLLRTTSAWPLASAVSVDHRSIGTVITNFRSLPQGLDYNKDFSPRDVQQEVFEKQIQIACEMKANGEGKALFLHQRDAHEDFVRIMNKYQGRLPNVVVHCFTGTESEALEYVAMGFYIGLTGERRVLLLLDDLSDHLI